MTSPITAPNPWSSRPFRLGATVAALAAAALAVPVGSSANSHKVHRVHDGERVALRLTAGDPSRIEVDAGDDGSADFSVDRARVHSIEVKMGDGNDSARIDDANGAFTDSIHTTIAGGDGNDTLEGGQVQVAAENETFDGGAGNDLVDGGKGNDIADL